MSVLKFRGKSKRVGQAAPAAKHPALCRGDGLPRPVLTVGVKVGVLCLLLTAGCTLSTRAVPDAAVTPPVMAEATTALTTEPMLTTVLTTTPGTPGTAVTMIAAAVTALPGTAESNPVNTPDPAITVRATRPLYTLTPRPTSSPQGGRTNATAGTPAPLITFTASPSPYPTQPPQPTVAYAGDMFTRVELDSAVVNLSGTWLSFMNVNDKAPETVTPGTPVAASSIATLYIANPANPGVRYRVLNLPTASSIPRIFWSPDPGYLAYFVSEADLSGIYLVDFKNAFETRFFAVDSLNPRGIASEPAWSPDGKQLTVTLTTAYDTDIYVIDARGMNFRNLSNSGGYDFWPRWSPDGRYLAFVSDRAQCPSWTPNAPNSCFKPDALPPTGGNLYVFETATGTTRKLSDAYIVDPPRWIAPDKLGFVSGQTDDPAKTALAWAGLSGDATRTITSTTDGTAAFDYSWSPDAGRVVYYEQGAESNAIVMRDSAGVEIARNDQYAFPRFGFAAAWSPDGARIVIGGRNGQCPYGMIITDPDLKVLYQGPQALGLCDPAWSSDGKFFSFVGVRRSNSQSDGRLDIYRASPNGGGQINVSGSYGGQIQFSGWVG